MDPINANTFDSLRLKLASPDDIHAWSHGEVLKPETINYRTQKPEKDGLFCERIFGPTKDWECYCGKYKKIRYKGIICDKCGVEVTRALVRRQRMGHIDLSVPISHIWFLRGVPSRVGMILDLSVQNLEKVIYFASFIITSVDEDLKNVTLEEVKQEFKSKKKAIENETQQKMNNIKTKIGKEEDPTNKQGMEEELVQLAKDKNKRMKELEEDFAQVEKELKELKALKIISEQAYRDLSLKYGHIFEAGIGAEAIRSLLEKVNVEETMKRLEEEIAESQGAKKDKMIRRLRLFRSLYKNNIQPEWMILTSVPVIPPDLRPMVPLDGGRFATSDLNDLYRRVINRNNRLKRLIELNAPEVICRNEKRMLQEAVDALIDNSARHSKTVVASTGQKRQLKSIADILKGKQGRFRQNLLGKRIDYSGRSVIVVGPSLRLHECGLPKRMALELFKPFVISRLIKKGIVHNIRSAGRFIEAGSPEVWDILEDITKKTNVLLNRAPTLHRLGIQAFRPRLIEGKAIQLHPLVCSAFNADFDGDQMAVHVPLTEEAKKEAEEIIQASHNLLKPATGDPVVTPGMDMTWGVFYMTSLEKETEEKELKIFSNEDEAITCRNLGQVGLRDKVKVRFSGNKKVKDGIVETSVGRIIFNRILPDKIPYLNEPVDKKAIGKIVKDALEFYTREEVVKLLDQIKEIGFEYATLSGYSWGMADLPLVREKQTMLDEGYKLVEEVEQQYEMGLLTKTERYRKIVEIWTEVKEKIVNLAKGILPDEGTVYSMVESKARGSWNQLAQMMGMKGLVTNPAGEIIELPIKGSFKEGFDVLEYFISTHGTRKGLADTALRTASAGYLTRRLVDVSQDIVIREDDCGDTEGWTFTRSESEELGLKLVDRVLGRFALEDVKDTKGKTIVKAGELINEEKARQLEKADVEEVKIRSILTCKCVRGVCKKCYGYDLGYNKIVEFGTAVGIIAAQSIGEPGTQLTMRTFHTGGVAGKGLDITQGLPRVEELLEVRPPKRKAFIAEEDGQARIKQEERTIRDASGKVIASTSYGQKTVIISYDELEEDKYKLFKSKKNDIKAADGAAVNEGDVLLVNEDGEVKAKRPGTVKLEPNAIKVVCAVEKEKEYIIPSGYTLQVRDGDLVSKGQALTDGSLDLAQVYKLQDKNAVQDYLIKEIQNIYLSHGQRVNEKHIEVIIRQMFSRVLLHDIGDTELLPGEIIERSEFEEANAKAAKNGGKPATAEELLLGISKVSLSTRSFLSAASFQETSKTLINAAISGKIDALEGLKENVIIGRLIPAGTGFGKDDEGCKCEV